MLPESKQPFPLWVGSTLETLPTKRHAAPPYLHVCPDEFELMGDYTIHPFPSGIWPRLFWVIVTCSVLFVYLVSPASTSNCWLLGGSVLLLEQDRHESHLVEVVLGPPSRRPSRKSNWKCGGQLLRCDDEVTSPFHQSSASEGCGPGESSSKHTHGKYDRRRFWEAPCRANLKSVLLTSHVVHFLE